MSQVIARNKRYLVVGLGMTGLSVARFLQRRGNAFCLADTRANLPGREAIEKEFPGVPVALGELPQEWLDGVDQLVVSPGLSLQDEYFCRARAMGKDTVTDIALFSEHARAPLIAITGSNGKSTVTALVGEMAKACGIKVAVGGNIGVPALDLLSDEIEAYVLELSSFQLEGVPALNAAVACVLNISPDHMDRYAGLQDYRAAKHRIFNGARQVVVNRDDPLTQPLMAPDYPVITYSLASEASLGVADCHGEAWLVCGKEPLIRCADIAIKGQHNRANALAALGLIKAMGWDLGPAVETLKRFKGLPHRCEKVADKRGVAFINDSKATNTGSTIAAIKGLTGEFNKLLLIAGGMGKGQDFSVLKEVLSPRYLRHLIVVGEAAEEIAAAATVPVLRARNLEEAVQHAAQLAEDQDGVLLSPACASFDMFANFEARGQAFVAAVEALPC